MARDPEDIQDEINRARDALAITLDELGTKADPKRFVEYGRTSVQEKLDDPTVRYVLIGVGALVTILVARKLFR